MIDALNAGIRSALTLPRVTFAPGIGGGAESWLERKHANGMVHEPATLGAFVALLPGRKRVWDVGAYYGYFSLFAKMARPDAEVTAFEMHPLFYAGLVRNVAQAGVITERKAVSDVTRLNVPAWVSAFNIFEDAYSLPPEAYKPRGPGASGGLFLDFLALDDYAAGPPADLIKIDVEAYQTKAVHGMRGLLRDARPAVIIELHDPEKLARMHTTNALTVQPFFDAGYVGYWCGNFRDADAAFEPLFEMGPEHERLSLAVFVPKEQA